MKVFQRQNKTAVFPSTQNLNLAELSQLRGTRVQPLTSGSPPCVEPRQTPTGMETILAVPACETHTRDHRATPLNALCPAQPPSRCSTGEEGARKDFLKPFSPFFTPEGCTQLMSKLPEQGRRNQPWTCFCSKSSCVTQRQEEVYRSGGFHQHCATVPPPNTSSYSRTGFAPTPPPLPPQLQQLLQLSTSGQQVPASPSVF